MVEIIDVSKKFGTVKALNEVNLSVGEKSVFGLVGSNGSGKSTLLRIMMDIYKADSGRVLYDGKDIKTYSMSGILPEAFDKDNL